MTKKNLPRICLDFAYLNVILLTVDISCLIIFCLYSNLSVRYENKWKLVVFFWLRLPFGAVPPPLPSRLYLYGMSWSPKTPPPSSWTINQPSLIYLPGHTCSSAITVPLCFGTYVLPKLGLLSSFLQRRHSRTLEPYCSVSSPYITIQAYFCPFARCQVVVKQNVH